MGEIVLVHVQVFFIILNFSVTFSYSMIIPSSVPLLGTPLFVGNFVQNMDRKSVKIVWNTIYIPLTLKNYWIHPLFFYFIHVYDRRPMFHRNLWLSSNEFE